MRLWQQLMETAGEPDAGGLSLSPLVPPASVRLRKLNRRAAEQKKNGPKQAEKQSACS